MLRYVSIKPYVYIEPVTVFFHGEDLSYVNAIFRDEPIYTFTKKDYDTLRIGTEKITTLYDDFAIDTVLGKFI